MNDLLEPVAALAEFHSHPNGILDDKTNGIPLRRPDMTEAVRNAT